MNRQTHNRRNKSKPNSGAFFGSMLGGFGAAVDGNIVGVFVHSANAANAVTARTKANRTKANNTLSPQARFQKHKDFLLVKLREARSRLSRGKEKLTWLSRRTIKADIPQLEELERQVANVTTMDELKRLHQQVLVAIGLK